MRRLYLTAFGAAASVCLLSMQLRAQDRDGAAPETTTTTVRRCVELHEQARIQRLEEHWQSAREAMNACASEECPLALRSDCKAWLEDVARQMPSLLIVVERDDDGRTPVRFELDGQPVDLPEPSGPIEVLPGAHRLRFSLPPYPDVEHEVTLLKGEKNHFLRVRFVRERPAAMPPVVASQPASPGPIRPVPVSTYLLAGGALAAFSVSAALLVSALSAKEDADSCAPLCDSGTRERIDTRLLLADISGALGLTLAGVAAYTFVSRPVVHDRAGAPTPRAMGGMVSVRGHF